MARRVLERSLALVLVVVAVATLVLPGAPAAAYVNVPVHLPAPGEPRVYLVGDSTLAGVTLSRRYGDLPGAYDAYVDAAVCRLVLVGSCAGAGGPNPMMDVLRRNEGRLGDAVVAMIGYNEYPALFARGIDAVMAEAARQGVPYVFWLTVHHPLARPFQGDPTPWPRTPGVSTDWLWNNLVLRDKVVEYAGRLQVIDWQAHAAGHPEWFWNDHIHLTPTGADAVMRLIRASLDQFLPLRSRVPTPPEPAPGFSTPPSRFVSIDPTRLLDTRDSRALAAGETRVVPVAGVAGVPSQGATSVALNLTVTGADRRGYATVWPTGQAQPLASNLNTDPGATRADLVVVPLGADGTVSLYSLPAAHYVIDVLGYFAPAPRAVTEGRIVPVAPARLLDTRVSGGPMADDGELALPVAGRGGIPGASTSGGAQPVVSGAVLTLTTVGAARPGYVTAWASGRPRPLASAVNQTPGGARANTVLVPLGADGAVALYTSTATHLVVDLVGYVTGPAAEAATAGRFVGLQPQRYLDSRSRDAMPTSGEVLSVAVAGRGGVPADATGVVATLTTTNGRAPAFAAVWPAGSAWPGTSVSNTERRAQDVAAGHLAGLGGGAVHVMANVAGDHIYDVSGYLTT